MVRVLAETTELVAWARGRFGGVELVAEHSWPHGESRVVSLVRSTDDRSTHDRLQVDDRAIGPATRERFVVKSVRQQVHFERERSGVEYAERILNDRAPRLLASDEPRLLLAFSHLPGRLAQHEHDHDPETHVRAAELLRRLHDGSPAETDSALGDRVRASFERFAARCGGLVAPDQLGAVRVLIERIEGAPIPVVACHGDFSPRNWLVADDGVVRVIDFGRFQRDHWTTDLLLLSRRYWPAHPGLRDACFAGYGRAIEEVDQDYVRAAIGRWAIGTILWAREHDDAPFEELGRQALADLLAR